MHHTPVCFIQDDDFVPAFWKRNFLLSEHLDFVPYNVDASENQNVPFIQLLAVKHVKLEGTNGSTLLGGGLETQAET